MRRLHTGGMYNRPPPPAGSDSYSYSNSQDSPFDPTSAHGPHGQHLLRLAPGTIGFQGYVVDTEEPFIGFHHIVIAYCLMTFALLYPLVVCGRYYRQNFMIKASDEHQQKQEGVMSPPGSDLMAGQTMSQSPNAKETEKAETDTTKGDTPNDDYQQQQVVVDPVTPVTSKSTVQDDPDNPINKGVPMPPVGPSEVDTTSQQPRPSASHVASSTGISRIPSAATTGLLYSSTRSSGAWPRHKHSRRPNGVPSWQWKRAIQAERRHLIRQQSNQHPSHMWRLKNSAVGVMSDLANSVLDAEQNKDTASQNNKTSVSGVDAALYNRKASRNVRSRRRRDSFNGSTRSGSVRSENRYQPSVMSSIVDDISPHDAADANDPGKVRAFDAPAQPRTKTEAALSAVEPWLEVAEPDVELKRLASLALPMTLGAVLEPLARCCLLGIISHWVGTHAMVAYLLVHLLYRLTGETLSVAITDAESTLVQMILTDTSKPNASTSTSNPHSSFTKEGYQQAGVYVKCALWANILIVGPVLVTWYFFIEDVVQWWVSYSNIALLAKEYFHVVVYLFLIQSLYRAIMVPCHIRGSSYASYETALDILTTVAVLVTVPVVLSKISDDVDENNMGKDYTIDDKVDNSQSAIIAVGWVQVNIGAAACILKVAFCILKGWLDHFGVLRVSSCLNLSSLCNLLLAAIPLVIGSVLEFGEVDLLTIFVRHLGPAEVGAWAVIACIWDVLQATTEGISEAAAIRVAYHLSASETTTAKKLARKALYWTGFVSLILSSLLLLLGRNLIVGLTVDYTLQHLLDDQVGLIALANLSLGIGQVCWSLIGAQGRFNLATLVILFCRWVVTMPLALIFIYALNYDEEALSGAVAVGSSTAACALGFVLFSSDWNEIAQELFMKGLLSCDDDDEFDFSIDDDDESSDGSSFGLGGYLPTKEKQKTMEQDGNNVEPQVTEPTARTNTLTGSHTNSGSHSGMHSGHSGLNSGHSGLNSGDSGMNSEFIGNA